MKEELFFKRNRKMAKKIVKIVNEEPKRRMIFALGAGHFIGNRSIISLLQSQGYNITHLKASDPLPRYGPSRIANHCKKQKKKKGRKNNRKRKRRRYRTRKHCNNDIPREKIVTPPPTFHPEPTRPNKKTTPKQLKTDHQRFKTTRQGKDRVGSHPIEPITVTVTHHTCRGSSKVLPTFGAREDSGGSGNAGSIVGIVLGILVLLAVVALFGYYLRRRKSTTRGKSRPRKTVSKDNLAEEM
ncbi:Hypothetical predicted protein [Paramuricea clavata]|uniref:Metalloprotease TIKI homolog n=1 Tax=Paramuricea clavata TaxID=317549 RepID=A0A6S7IRG5_PARCT|nr:Hypothetical predicted protein [Paramuricea clavata]